MKAESKFEFLGVEQPSHKRLMKIVSQKIPKLIKLSSCLPAFVSHSGCILRCLAKVDTPVTDGAHVDHPRVGRHGG